MTEIVTTNREILQGCRDVLYEKLLKIERLLSRSSDIRIRYEYRLKYSETQEQIRLINNQLRGQS